MMRRKCRCIFVASGIYGYGDFDIVVRFSDTGNTSGVKGKLPGLLQNECIPSTIARLKSLCWSNKRIIASSFHKQHASIMHTQQKMVSAHGVSSYLAEIDGGEGGVGVVLFSSKYLSTRRIAFLAEPEPIVFKNRTRRNRFLYMQQLGFSKSFYNKNIHPEPRVTVNPHRC